MAENPEPLKLDWHTYQEANGDGKHIDDWLRPKGLRCVGIHMDPSTMTATIDVEKLED
jgi:hypothetical protein